MGRRFLPDSRNLKLFSKAGMKARTSFWAKRWDKRNAQSVASGLSLLKRLTSITMFTLNRKAFAPPLKSQRTWRLITHQNGCDSASHVPSRPRRFRMWRHLGTGYEAVAVRFLMEWIKLRRADLESGASHIGEVLCHNWCGVNSFIYSARWGRK